MTKIIRVGISEKYQTIKEGLKVAKPHDTLWLMDADYYEKVKITTPGIIIQGSKNTRIHYHDYATKIHQDGREYVTFRTYTLMVCCDDVILKDLIIENDAGSGRLVGQAVALHLYGDNIHINNCLIKAHQDTVFVGPLPDDLIARYVDLLPADERRSLKKANQFFNNCHIIGDIDFIFGCGHAVFENCKIESLPQIGGRKSFICAPAHAKSQTQGIEFKNCQIISSSSQMQAYLARPWRDYGLCVFENCFLGQHIMPAGFDKWNDTNRDQTCRFYEINSQGLGSKTSQRVPWIKKSLPE